VIRCEGRDLPPAVAAGASRLNTCRNFGYNVDKQHDPASLRRNSSDSGIISPALDNHPYFTGKALFAGSCLYMPCPRMREMLGYDSCSRENRSMTASAITGTAVAISDHTQISSRN